MHLVKVKRKYFYPKFILRMWMRKFRCQCHMILVHKIVFFLHKKKILLNLSLSHWGRAKTDNKFYTKSSLLFAVTTRSNEFSVPFSSRFVTPFFVAVVIRDVKPFVLLCNVLYGMLFSSRQLLLLKNDGNVFCDNFAIYLAWNSKENEKKMNYSLCVTKTV